MQTIETTATVTPDGTLVVAVPPTVTPGPHRVVIVIEEALLDTTPLALRPIPLPTWPPDATFRREEVYGDDAR
ncbi:MAG TPA: hypothetical protein VFZ66_13485 [Herpetosiphonaceae bacterium]